ncbi:hypothetical protein [uncultured Campylobacter sp.]|uniref:hypothetical protein n=1 Tax=uncultured Campylobacter sp. TaxID=218934 RepID=UPI002621B477|nr:hypothetical protein [uncultured Campylobacter sp.]
MLQKEVDINLKKISKGLGCPVVATNSAKGVGKEEVMEAILSLFMRSATNTTIFKINYEELEPFIEELEPKFRDEKLNISSRWLTIKALESDNIVFDLFKDEKPKKLVLEKSELFKQKYNKEISFLAAYRHDSADII